MISIFISKEKLEYAISELWEKVSGVFCRKGHTHNSDEVLMLPGEIATLTQAFANQPVERGTGKQSVQLKDPNRTDVRTGATGEYATAFGYGCTASGARAYADGYKNKAQGQQSRAEGNANTVTGDNAHAEGMLNTVIGHIAHAEGQSNTIGENGAEGITKGYKSHAEGQGNVVKGNCSHAEGLANAVTGNNAHAEGQNNTAEGTNSHVEGKSNAAVGLHAHAEGQETLAMGANSHAEGLQTKAHGNKSHAEGYGTITNHDCEHACGMFNKSNYKDANNQTLFSVGIGTSDEERRNAVEVLKNGKVLVNGIGGYDGTNPFECKFGGIICLTLGATMSADMIAKTISSLNDILTNKQHYIITIYDTVEDKFFGDCEVVQAGTNSVNIIACYTSTTLTSYTVYYSFKTDTKTYTRNKYSVAIASKGSVTALEKEVAVQTCVELMIYNKGLYVIAPNGYISINDTDVEFARYVKTSARYYTTTPKKKFHRKKKGWVTPREGCATGNDHLPIVNFSLEEQTAEFKHISETNRQIFELVFQEENYLGDYIAEAFKKPIPVTGGSSVSLTNKKLGIRLVNHGTGLPITDWLPFCVRYNKWKLEDGSTRESIGLSRWV